MVSSFTFLTALGLGILHALEPGHGKSVILSYSLGQKVRPFGYFSMGVGMVVAHSLLLLSAALLLKYMATMFDGEALTHMIGKVAPFLVIAFGIYLFFGHSHDHEDKQKQEKSPFIAGFIAGLLPCPTMIVPLALSGVDNFQNGIQVVGIYMLGMAITIAGFLILIYFAKEMASGFLKKVQTKVNIQKLSASLVIVAGVIYAILAFAIDHQH